MKAFFILLLVCSCILQYPCSASLSNFFASPILASTAKLIASIPQPLIEKVEGIAPASTTHAKHAEEIKIPRELSQSFPATAPQLISSYGFSALAPAPLISIHNPQTVSSDVNDQS